MIRETGEVLGCPSVRVSVLVQVASCDGKTPAEGKPRYNPMGKDEAKQPKKSEELIVCAQSVLVACGLKSCLSVDERVQ